MFQVFQKAVDINLLGPTRVNQIMLPLIRRARGRVVYLTSGLCRIASPVRGIHCALLAAIESQAMCLREELRSKGVDVVVVAPSEYSTGNAWLSDEQIREQAKDMWRQLHKEQRHAYGEDYFESAIRSLEKYSKPHVIIFVCFLLIRVQSNQNNIKYLQTTIIKKYYEPHT